MAVPTKNPEYEKLKEDAKELIAAGGCFAIQYWMHTYALEICPEKYNTLEKQLEAPIYTDEWVKTGKKAVELIQKGIDILEKKTSTPPPSTVKEEESQDDYWREVYFMITSKINTGNGDIIKLLSKQFIINKTT